MNSKFIFTVGSTKTRNNVNLAEPAKDSEQTTNRESPSGHGNSQNQRPFLCQSRGDLLTERKRWFSGAACEYLL